MNSINFAPKQSVLIIAGMHRSGTSLIASLLQSAGLDIGQELMGANESNIKGHFEDLDFVRFHEQVLRSQGFSPEGWVLQENILVQEQYLEKAKVLIREKQSQDLWGWKDPRTTLFLDFWAELIPEAKFLFVYRSPWEVIDSLYRRGGYTDDVFINNPNFALALWMNYNKALLHFYDRFSEKCIILNLSTIARDPNSLIKAVDKKFGISLQTAENLYDESLLHHQVSTSHRPTLLKHYFPEALGLYYELSTRDTIVDSQFGSFLAEESTRFASDRAWILQDWLDVRKLERSFKHSKSEVAQTQAELEQTQAELKQSWQQLEQTQTELGQTQAELKQSWQQLEQSQSNWNQIQQKFEQSQSRLYEAHAQLVESQSQLYQSQSHLARSQTNLHQTQAQLEVSQGQLHQTQSQLEQSQARFHQTQAQLEVSQGKLHQTQSRLEQSQAKFHQTQSHLERVDSYLQEAQQEWESNQAKLQQIQQKWEELQIQLRHAHEQLRESQAQNHLLQDRNSHLQSQVQQTQTEFQQTQEQLARSQSELHDIYRENHRLQERVSAMETSKFWKLRRIWFRLKRSVGIEA